MNPLNDKKRLCARAGWLAAAAIAVVLWAGFTWAGTDEVDTARRHDLVSRYLRAVYAQDYAKAYEYISQRDRRAKSEAAYLRENPSLTGAAAELTRGLAERIEMGPLPAEARADGTLEVRVKDHRNAIDDFRSVDLSLGKLRLAPYPGLKSSEPGWLELAPRLDRMDLTRYKDGTSAATVYRGALRPRRFAAVDLQVTGIRGILRKTGAPDQVKNAVGPIRLDFELKPAATTVVILDLELIDLSDHPGRGYELLVKGYELYEDDRLLQRIPPG